MRTSSEVLSGAALWDHVVDVILEWFAIRTDAKFRDLILCDSRPVLDGIILPPMKVVALLQDADTRLDPPKQVNLVLGIIKTVKVINVFGCQVKEGNWGGDSCVLECLLQRVVLVQLDQGHDHMSQLFLFLVCSPHD